MLANDVLTIFLGATVLGMVHGAEPGHGWPIAATYALNRSNKWRKGFVASSLLGIGHLFSSLTVVGAFFLAKSYFDLTQLSAPVTVYGFQIGSPIGIVSGVLLILLGIREYRHDHDHDHDEEHRHETQHGKADTHGEIKRKGNERSAENSAQEDHSPSDGTDNRGLFGIVWTAFVLGFAHEEEFEIIGLCLGTDYCLELMLIYSVAVLVALVGLTMFLVAGYERYEEKVEKFTSHLPLVSAIVLISMGLGFTLGIF